MPFYQKQGEIPPKRHIQFRNEKNDLLWEELISREGFSSIYSNVYHKNPPTAIEAIGELKRPLYKESELVADKEYVIKKLGFTEKEFDEIMNNYYSILNDIWLYITTWISTMIWTKSSISSCLIVTSISISS